MLGAKGKGAPEGGLSYRLHDMLKTPEKPRGLLSFLTSPFVLAQLFVAEQVLGNTAHAALAPDEGNVANPDPQPPGSGDDTAYGADQSFAKGRTLDAPDQHTEPNLSAERTGSADGAAAAN